MTKIQISATKMKAGHRETILSEILVTRLESRLPTRGNSKFKVTQVMVAQWLRICLPMQGTRVQALVWEDPICRGATRPMSHNY